MTINDCQSVQIGELAAALSKVQNTLEGVEKESSNPFFKSKYADLHSTWQSCRVPLSENGLSVSQIVQVVNEKPCLVTMLMHSSGQWIKSMMPIITSKPDIQGFGSSLTYCRRYALQAIVGISAYDDDGEEDAKAAREKAARESIPKKVAPESYNTIEDLHIALEKAGHTSTIGILKEFLSHLREKYPSRTEKQLIDNALIDQEQIQKFNSAFEKWTNLKL